MEYLPQVKAKLHRAVSLIEQLKVEIDVHLHSENFFIEKDLAGTDTWQLTVRMRTQPPMELGVMVGEVIHDLRSSLDIALSSYLEIAFPNEFERLKPRVRNKIKFPVADTEASYLDTKWHANLGDDQLLQDLRTVQPFQNLQYAEADVDKEIYLSANPLHQLQQLWNKDKHRGINLVVGGLHMLMLGLDAGQESEWKLLDRQPWVDGSKAFLIRVKSESAVLDLNLTESFAIGLESDIRPLNIYPVVDKLKALYGHVEHCHWVLSRWFEYRTGENLQ